MKVVLNKEEVVQATISYLKGKALISPDLDFIGTVSDYNRDGFLVITEFKPEITNDEVKKEEE